MEISCCSPVINHDFNNIEKFYLCSNLPIKYISSGGEIIYTAGYNKDFEDVYQKLNVYETLISKICKKDSTATAILSSGFMEFYISYVCLHNVNKGVYIIGPYSNKPSAEGNLVYKPQDCMPHLVTLLRNIAEASPLTKPKNDSNHGLYVSKAMGYIDTKFNEPLTVGCISHHLGISKCYFCTLFKNETGKTFTQVLNEVRVARSKELLLESRQSILDIAISIGYNNQNYYNMIFKKLNEVTPHQYRSKGKSS